jgi:hypothetical protein
MDASDYEILAISSPINENARWFFRDDANQAHLYRWWVETQDGEIWEVKAKIPFSVFPGRAPKNIALGDIKEEWLFYTIYKFTKRK